MKFRNLDKVKKANTELSNCWLCPKHYQINHPMKQRNVFLVKYKPIHFSQEMIVYVKCIHVLECHYSSIFTSDASKDRRFYLVAQERLIGTE